MREPSFAESSKTTSDATRRAAFVVKSNVPRVPVPEVAVTKFSSTTLPVGVDELVVERRLEGVRRSGDAERARDLLERERRLDEDRGVWSSKSARV